MKTLDHPAPSLGILRHKVGMDSVQAYLKLWLIDFSISCLPEGKGFTPAQIDDMAFLIYSKYPHLKIAELNLIFTNAKTGEYGEIFTTPTSATVMSWFSKHWKQRDEMAILMSENEAMRHKSYFSDAPRSSQTTIREDLKKAKEKLFFEETKKQVEGKLNEKK